MWGKISKMKDNAYIVYKYTFKIKSNRYLWNIEFLKKNSNLASICFCYEFYVGLSPEHVSGACERSGHFSLRAESAFLKIPLHSLNTLSAAHSTQNALW